MIGSYGPSPEPVRKRFVAEESPSGMLARSGSYAVRSRVIDGSFFSPYFSIQGFDPF